MSKTHREGINRTKDGVELRVAGGSPASKVAGAIVKYLNEGEEPFLLAMGAGAVNQAVKAICIARGMAAPQGINLYTIPAFVDEVADGFSKTAIKFIIVKG